MKVGSQKSFPLGGESLGNFPHLSFFLCQVINICLTCQETGRATQKDTKEIPPETYEKALYNQKIVIIINTTPYLLKLQNSCIHNYPEPTTNFKSFCTTIDFFPPNQLLYSVVREAAPPTGQRA